MPKSDYYNFQKLWQCWLGLKAGNLSACQLAEEDRRALMELRGWASSQGLTTTVAAINQVLEPSVQKSAG
jgi:hypothetical protein